MADTKTIEKILTSLIKDGDKETISDVILLLQSIKDFKKGSGTTSRTPRTVVQEEFKGPSLENPAEYASTLLGMMSETPRAPSQIYYNGAGVQSRPSAAEYIPDEEMMSHAGALL